MRDSLLEKKKERDFKVWTALKRLIQQRHQQAKLLMQIQVTTPLRVAEYTHVITYVILDGLDTLTRPHCVWILGEVQRGMGQAEPLRGPGGAFIAQPALSFNSDKLQ